MRVTIQLLSELRTAGKKKAISVRLHKKIVKHVQDRAIQLGISQARYLEGLILAEAQTTTRAQRQNFELTMDNIRKHVC